MYRTARPVTRRKTIERSYPLYGATIVKFFLLELQRTCVFRLVSTNCLLTGRVFNVNQNISATKWARGIVWTLFLNGVVPLILYTILKHQMSNIQALAIATAIPVLDNVWTIIKQRRVDILALFTMIGFLLELGILLIHGNAQLLLLRGAFVTGMLGITFLGSLLFPRPLIYYFAIRFNSSEEGRNRLSSLWSNCHFRRRIRITTLVWGVALLSEALLETVLIYSISTSEFVIISPFIQYGIIGLAFTWTHWYRRKVRTSSMGS
ncbi:VC0807 family protein [Alicyclobacillus fodiniaquatilis]|uniref:VC0807 family protein n=1 Tax=Alicyclobacillus fodiniaquatilis TaxID=1661150 RepID=A0ABW4JQH9_9BACL